MVSNVVDIDKTGLESRIFTAFAETSTRRYIYVCNMQTGVSRWSRSAVEYFGLPGEYFENAGEIWAEYIHPDDRQMYLDDIDAVFSGKKSKHEIEYRARNKKGNYVICSCRGIVLKGENGEPDYFAGTMANHGIVENIDSTTNLYNIYEFMNATRTIHQLKETALIMMIGVNHFSNINDVYGYVFGNEVLRSLADMIRSIVQGRGMVYRMDGSKFAMCLRGMDERQGRFLYEEIKIAAREKLIVRGIQVPLSISGGGVLHKDFGAGDYPVRASAAYALESSKHDRNGEFVYFNNELGSESMQQMELVNNVRSSVVNRCNGFFLCYQPIVSADAAGRIVGAEALLRWQNDQYGIVYPDKFIPWLENDSSFLQLGTWVLRKACSEMRGIVEDNPDFVLNVNISYAQMDHNGFRDTVTAILLETGYPAENLCLELTERCKNIQMERLREELNFYRSIGIRIALDDFGTGSASLNMLRLLPIDTLKIDKSYISGIMENQAEYIIVDSVINCAARLGSKVCIEGVEDKELRDFLLQFPADYHQGYYYSRPVQFESFIEMYQNCVWDNRMDNIVVDKISFQ